MRRAACGPARHPLAGAFAGAGAGEGIVMSRWPAIVLGAVTAGALAVAGCGGSQPGAAGKHGATPSRPAAPSAPGSHPAATAPAPGASSGAVVNLQSSEQVPFTGDTVLLRVQAAAGPGSPQWLRLATATVRLGDGTSATVTGKCTGPSLPPPSAGLLVRHVYRHAGVVSPSVTAAAVCGHGAATGAGLAGAGLSLRVLPAAPAASASWPQCRKAQLTMTATGEGAALGHVGVLFTMRNTSSASCRLEGYPGLQLLDSEGRALPTTVLRAVSGAYLFPAVMPHSVAIPSGAVGSFDLQYFNSPVGAAANEPYPTACPAAAQVEVTLPSSAGSSVVPASMAPCEGQVLVSPVVPGAQWLAP
jgi:hypothetical protein